jgi:hypothetical protein
VALAIEFPADFEEVFAGLGDGFFTEHSFRFNATQLPRRRFPVPRQRDPITGQRSAMGESINRDR